MVIMLNIENLLDELKTVKEEECLNSSYDGITQIHMKEVPSPIIKVNTYEIFHSENIIVLSVELRKTYFSLKTLAKISEICYKYSDEVNINLLIPKIIIRCKR